jgi:hypothetical protein
MPFRTKTDPFSTTKTGSGQAYRQNSKRGCVFCRCCWCCTRAAPPCSQESSAPVRQKTHLFCNDAIPYTENAASFYQDRLGTNIAKALKKEEVYAFFRRESHDVSRLDAADSACPRPALCALWCCGHVFLVPVSAKRIGDLPRQARDKHRKC